MSIGGGPNAVVADDVVASTRMGEEATQVGWRGVTRGPSGQCFVYPTTGWAPGLTRLNTPTTPQGGGLEILRHFAGWFVPLGGPLELKTCPNPKRTGRAYGGLPWRCPIVTIVLSCQSTTTKMPSTAIRNGITLLIIEYQACHSTPLVESSVQVRTNKLNQL